MRKTALALVLLALPGLAVRSASADKGRDRALGDAGLALAAPGLFDGVRGAPLPGLLPALPEIPAPPPVAVPTPGVVDFNGVALPSVAFTAVGPVSVQLVKAIDATQGSLKLLLYDFALPDVWEALGRAVSRSPAVEVQVVLDQAHVFPKSGRKRGEWIEKLLAEPRIKTRIVSGLGDFGIMHDKIAIFDGRLLKTGSYNWTRGAEGGNHENAVFTVEASRVALYEACFQWIWDNSYPPKSPMPPPSVGAPPTDPSPGVAFHNARFPLAAFSPKGGAGQKILDAIRFSTSSIDVAMFSFTSKPLAQALAERAAAGVRVRVLLDRKQAGNAASVKAFLMERGIDVAVMDGQTKVGSLHDKFGIFDGSMVETGSYNWTANAEHYSFENAAFLGDPADVASFRETFERLKALAVPPQPPAGPAVPASE